MKMVKIDPLYFLLLIELALILFVLVVYLFFRNRKHKDLYQKTLRKLNDLKSEISVETLDRPASSESAFAETLSEPQPETLPENLMEEEQQPLQDSGVPEFLDAGQPGDKEGGAMPGQVRRLQRMVNSQKSTILELMCYKDVFEGARKRLALLQQDNSELQDKIKDFIEGGAEGTGFGEALAALEESNRDLDKYITVLDREDERLTEKFQAWEEEF